eukprot:Phypoly_transcript_10082.p1 GENE.Phypoly_transcript_10082~~Phypoly_transcript_10082.p1  ORF type:complete len:356 (+),score=41.00 Phypoly_transcript_10082:200-1267(+)
MYGTLGKKWDSSWKNSAYEVCLCAGATNKRECTVFHGKEADVEVFGECVLCAKDNKEKGALAVKRLKLGFLSTLQDNFVECPLECGHHAVGITKIWTHLFVNGSIKFLLKVECFNLGCSEGNKTVTCSFTNMDSHEVKDLTAVPCCEKPLISLVSLRGIYTPAEDMVSLKFKRDREVYEHRNRPKNIKFLPIQQWKQQPGEVIPAHQCARAQGDTVPPWHDIVVVRKVSNPLHPADNKRGLFVAPGVVIEKDSEIGDYGGEIKHEAAWDSRYFVPLFDANIGAQDVGNAFHFINDYRNTGKMPNVRFLPKASSSGQIYIAVIALADIQGGQELLADYGEECWENAQENNKKQRLL